MKILRNKSKQPSTDEQYENLSPEEKALVPEFRPKGSKARDPKAKDPKSE